MSERYIKCGWNQSAKSKVIRARKSAVHTGSSPRFRTKVAWRKAGDPRTCKGDPVCANLLLSYLTLPTRHET